MEQEKRLIDAVPRKNIYEIKDVIRRLRDIEIDEGFTKTDRPLGLQYLYEDRFCKTLNRIKTLKKSTLFASGFAILTIACSLICLSLVDTILLYHCAEVITLIGNLFLTMTTLVISFYVLYMGLIDNTVHETDRNK